LESLDVKAHRLEDNIVGEPRLGMRIRRQLRQSGQRREPIVCPGQRARRLSVEFSWARELLKKPAAR